MALRKGSELGKYKLERRLGTGNFAEVWRALDRVERRRVALKITHEEARDQFGREELEHEAQIASRLNHPNILALRNADWHEGRLVFASELARSNLAQYRQARRSPARALDIIRQVSAGLAYAHEQKILHRDVKPENILIFPDGRAALTDFDVARLFTGGTLGTMTEAGTLGYLAPEAAYGRPSFSSDVFSLGMVAYQILTGILPKWPFDWPPDGYRKFRAKVPAPLQPVLRKAMEFKPNRRYRNGMELHRALERAFSRIQKKKSRPKTRKIRKKKPSASPLEFSAERFRREYGSPLELKFRCRRCEGPISETMTYCPWCGYGENSFLEISKFPMVCPECERGVRPEWSYCPWCPFGRFQSNGRKPPRDSRAERACPEKGCNGQLRRFMRYCPLCNRKVLKLWTVRELKERCPRCRWPVSRTYWRFCPWCGRREPSAGTFPGKKTRA